MTKIIGQLIRLPALVLIRWYQKTLSPDTGWFRVYFPHGFCRFYPSCSEYMYRAIAKHGLFKGLWYGSFRLMRCHPWSAGGYDPV